jgi:hypothetical protein
VLETLLQFITGENMSARLLVCFFGGIRGTFDVSKFQIEGKVHTVHYEHADPVNSLLNHEGVIY